MFILPGRSIPYHLHLEDRRFEEFVRDLYLQDIQSGFFENQFDDVILLNGISEQGRDCILLKNKKHVGVGQCKLYNSPLTKPAAIKEILKFCLYSIVYPEHIFDKNTFEYHFICPNGFNNPALLLLEDFNNQILSEKKLGQWAEQIFKTYKTINNVLEFDKIKDQLYSLLVSIKIEVVTGEELDRRLSFEHNKNLYSIYFDVKKVVDNSALEPIQHGLEQLRRPQLIYNESLLKELQDASFTLYMCKNYFGNLTDTNIKRKETSELLNWIKTSSTTKRKQEPDNILFLSGSAGSGKTTILHDLYTLLKEQQIPVLGLKSDSLIAKNLEELRLKINLSHSITKSLEEASKHHECIVLLIDQIDALSQYLSSNRDYINTYLQLIETLRTCYNIKIVVSVREYDFNYDLALQHYCNCKKIQVEELSEKDVEFVLSKLGLSKRHLSETLFSLIRNPNHLDVFCRIYNNNTNVSSIKSLQDLYSELWNQLMSSLIINKENLKKLIYSIVEKQYQQQIITVSNENFSEEFASEYSFLKSKGIILEEKKILHFFHQSFYDYLFAKSFIERKENIIQYIKRHNQSLEIRSSLKMITAYLSTSDRKEYIKITIYILKSREIRFHIKSLMISLLGHIENPQEDEKQLVEKLIKPNKKFYAIFIDSLISKGWLVWLIKRGYLKSLLEMNPTKADNFFAKESTLTNFIKSSILFKNYIPFEIRKRQILNSTYYLLQRNSKTSIDEILDFLNSFDFKEKKSFTEDILYHYKDWTNPLAFKLFDYCKDDINLHFYYTILENIVPVNVDFVINEIKADIYDSIFDRDNNRREWHEKEDLLELMFKVSPEKSITFLFETVLAAIKKHEHLWTNDEDKLLVPDGIFQSISIVEREHHYNDSERIYVKLINWIRDISIINPSFYDNFLRTNSLSKYQSIVRLAICGLNKPNPDKEDLIVLILERLAQINKITDHGELQGDLNRLIANWFPILSKKNKRTILNIIMNLRHKGELRTWESEGKRKYYSSYGLIAYLYLQALPLDYIYSDIDAKKLYQELNRKFKEEKPSNHLYSTRFSMGGVRPPIKNEAYSYMTDEQWLQSFIKYKEENVSFDFKGGREQHARRFEDEIKTRPADFINLIYKMIACEDIHNEYITYALSALGECNLSNDTITDIFVKAVENKRYSDEKLIYVVWAIKNLFIKKIENDTLTNFIVALALNHPDPSDERIKMLRNSNRDLYGISINSVRGASVEALYTLDMKKYGNIVFETVRKVASSDNEDVLSSVLVKIAYLNSYDIEKSFSLFLSIIEKASDELFLYSLHSVQYFVSYGFSQLNTYFLRARNIENKNFKGNMSELLYFAWLWNCHNAESVLFDFINNDSDCICCVIHCAISNFYHENDIDSKKALFILNKYLNLTDDSISHQYDCCFLHYKEAGIKFKDLYPFTFEYIQSKSLDSKKYYVLDYLLINSAEYPDECFLIFRKMKLDKLRNEPQSEYSSHVREKQMKLLLGFFAIFNQNNKYKRELKYIDKTFDKLYEDINYKDNMDKALDLISK